MKTIMFLVVAGMLLASGCVKEDYCIHGEGPVTEVALNLDEFNSIDLRGSMNVVISHGETREVVAKGHRNIIDHLETMVRDGIWSIGLDQGCYSLFELTVYITLPDISRIELNGSGNITLQDFVNDGDLTIESNGSGKIETRLIEGVQSLTVRMTGSGRVICADSYPDLDSLMVQVTGSGSFKGYEAKAKSGVVRSSGSGNCEVSATESLDVRISGSGNVYYKGRPTIDVDDSGSGRLVKVN